MEKKKEEKEKGGIALTSRAKVADARKSRKRTSSGPKLTRGLVEQNRKAGKRGDRRAGPRTAAPD